MLRPDDYAEVALLMARYATALDRRDWGLVMECFSADALAEYPFVEIQKGNRAIADANMKLLSHVDRTQHLVSVPYLEERRGGVFAITNVIAQHARVGPDGIDLYTVGGRYHDRLVRDDYGWKIAHRTLEVVWETGDEAILRGRSPDHPPEKS